MHIVWHVRCFKDLDNDFSFVFVESLCFQGPFSIEPQNGTMKLFLQRSWALITWAEEFGSVDANRNVSLIMSFILVDYSQTSYGHASVEIIGWKNAKYINGCMFYIKLVAVRTVYVTNEHLLVTCHGQNARRINKRLLLFRWIEIIVCLGLKSNEHYQSNEFF